MNSDEVKFEPWTYYWSIYDTTPKFRTAYVLCPGMGSTGVKDLCIDVDGGKARLIRFGYAWQGNWDYYGFVKNTRALASNNLNGMWRMDRIVRLSALIKNLVKDSRYSCVYLMGFSHGALLIHAAYLHLLVGLTDDKELKIMKQKIRFVSIGAPRYVDPKVFGHTYPAKITSPSSMPPPVLNLYYYNDLVLRNNRIYDGIVKFKTPDFKKYDKPANEWKKILREDRPNLTLPTQKEKLSVLSTITEAIKYRIYNLPIFKSKALQHVEKVIPPISFDMPRNPDKYIHYIPSDGVAVCLRQYEGKHPADTHVILYLLDCVFGRNFVTVINFLPDHDPDKENNFTELKVTNTIIEPSLCKHYFSSNFFQGGDSKAGYERTSERRRCSDGKVRTVYKKGSQCYVKRRTQNGSYKYSRV